MFLLSLLVFEPETKAIKDKVRLPKVKMNRIALLLRLFLAASISGMPH